MDNRITENVSDFTQVFVLMKFRIVVHSDARRLRLARVTGRMRPSVRWEFGFQKEPGNMSRDFVCYVGGDAYLFTDT